MGTFDEVEIYVPFSDRWVGGYEVAEKAGQETDAFWVRRQSDGEVLPGQLPADRIRPAHSGPPA